VERLLAPAEVAREPALPGGQQDSEIRHGQLRRGAALPQDREAALPRLPRDLDGSGPRRQPLQRAQPRVRVGPVDVASERFHVHAVTSPVLGDASVDASPSSIRTAAMA
jgi:hypothetical protein